MRTISSAVEKSLLDEILLESNAILDELGAPRSEAGFAGRWCALAARDRRLCGVLYDSVKTLPSVIEAASRCARLPAVIERAQQPSIIDINLRFDAYGEGQFAFDWHQDFWFLMASRRALVVWIPLLELDGTNGGIELCERLRTSCPYGTLPCKESTGEYASYASSLVLDGDVSRFCERSDVVCIDRMPAGDAVLFDFLSLHRSLPVPRQGGLRFTLQVRIADFKSDEFRAAGFKKCVHNRTKMKYLDHINGEGCWNGTF